MSLDSAERNAAQRLLALLSSYPREEVRPLVAMLALTAAAEADVEVSPEVAALIGELATAAGIPAGASREQADRALAEHFRKHPLNAKLLAEARALLREESRACVEARGEGLSRRFLGDAIRSFAKGSQSAAPEGAVKMSPLAQFTMDPAKSKPATTRRKRR
jgi:hypothetical protein